MKRILTFFLVAFSTYAIAQDKDAGFIGGKNTFYGTVTDQEVTIDYRAKVKYSATLFGGIKVNATITEFVFWNVRYKGKKMSNAVYDELGIGDKDGYIKPNKQSQFDFTTDVEFYTHITNDIMIRDIKFVAVGWGTLDEYTYLKKEKVKDIKIFFNLTKENIKDFYKLNMKFYNLEITSFTISIIQDIKNAMDKETAGEKELERKLAALQKLQPDANLTVNQLNRKVSLLNDVIDKGYTDCYGYHTCHRALANAQAEIEERKEKGEKEDEEEKEAVAEKKEDTQDKDKNTEEQQRLAQEQKQQQAEAKRKAAEAKKKAEQKRLAEAERKRKEEANRKAEEAKNREWNETVEYISKNIGIFDYTYYYDKEKTEGTYKINNNEFIFNRSFTKYYSNEEISYFRRYSNIGNLKNIRSIKIKDGEEKVWKYDHITSEVIQFISLEFYDEILKTNNIGYKKKVKRDIVIVVSNPVPKHMRYGGDISDLKYSSLNMNDNLVQEIIKSF